MQTMSYSISGCLIVLFAVAVSTSYGQEAQGEFVVDVVTKNQNRLQFPYFSPEVKTIDPQLRDMLVDDGASIIAEFSKTLNKRLTAKSGYFNFAKGYLDWSVFAANLVKLNRAQEEKKKKLGVRKVGTKGTFNKSMQTMFGQMMELAKVEAAKSAKEPKNNDKLARDIEIYLEDLQEAIAKSPVAGYFGWSEGFINGVNFMEYSARLMGRLSNHGYGGVFSCVSTLLATIVRFQG